jgi:ABC-type nitrate/sulfonate/bicarbonate transport system substrate-binding protein
VCAVAALLGGCGGSSNTPSGPTRAATLVLDFTPNPVHVGIYAAIANHFDTAAGVKLHVIAPSASTDAIRLLETGRVNFAILDIHDLAIARERGEAVRGILPIVEEPLAAVIAQENIKTNTQLDGKTVGVSGDPSDLAVLNSILGPGGVRAHHVKTITIGFNAVSDLLAHKVDAATAFWNDEGVTLERRAPGVQILKVTDYGAPSYPELVLCATAKSLKADPSLARGVVRALVRGYDFALAHPSQAQRALESAAPGLDHKLDTAELGTLSDAFRGQKGFGVLDPSTLINWSQWEVEHKLVKHQPNVAQMFDTQFAPKPPATATESGAS